MSIASRFRGAFFTDLDGTLLDRDSFRPSLSAMAALRTLHTRDLAIVPVSSKTAAELTLYPEILDLCVLALMEGGGVVVRRGLPPQVCGPGRDAMMEALAELMKRGFPVRGISEMSDEELIALTGLPEDRISFARERLVSEPFSIDGPVEPWIDELRRQASSLGVDVVQGGVLWHLVPSGGGKGAAVRRTLDSEPGFGGVPSGAVGDAWNDLPMLIEVDQGYLLGSAVADGDMPEGVLRILRDGPSGLVVAAEAFLDYCRMEDS